MKKNNVLIKVITIFSIAIISCSCTTQKNICNENIEFKKIFFQSIQNAEEVIYGKSHNRTKYDEGLGFLNHYVFVDYEKTLNYRGIYTLKGFEDDKKKWIDWYEQNKCSNIQFK